MKKMIACSLSTFRGLSATRSGGVCKLADKLQDVGMKSICVQLLKKRIKMGWIGGLSVISGLAVAEPALLNDPAAKAFIQEMVTRDHYDKEAVVAALRAATYQQNIIDAMNHPYEQKPWDTYQSLFLTEERVREGLLFWKENQVALRDAEAKFGVPADMIVAIIGIETLYGRHQGNYRVLDALTTLAFHYPKRSAYFIKELREYLLLCREHHVPATRYLGSYAGAMGKPQFMPSSYRIYAVNFKGKGQRADLMREDRDVIGSVANYFHQHGWKPHEKVAEPTFLTHWASQHLTINAKFPNYTLQQLRQTGIKPVGTWSPSHAGVLEFMNTTKAQEYWLAYPNFYVITRYNTSPQYALAAYLLSQRLRQQWALVKETHRAHA